MSYQRLTSPESRTPPLLAKSKHTIRINLLRSMYSYLYIRFKGYQENAITFNNVEEQYCTILAWYRYVQNICIYIKWVILFPNSLFPLVEYKIIIRILWTSDRQARSCLFPFWNLNALWRDIDLCQNMKLSAFMRLGWTWTTSQNKKIINKTSATYIAWERERAFARICVT